MRKRLCDLLNQEKKEKMTMISCIQHCQGIEKENEQLKVPNKVLIIPERNNVYICIVSYVPSLSTHHHKIKYNEIHGIERA